MPRCPRQGLPAITRWQGRSGRSAVLAPIRERLSRRTPRNTRETRWVPWHRGYYWLGVACMLAERVAPLSEADYLAMEAESSCKHEFLAGEVYALAGATEAHNRLVTNLIVELG